MREDPAHDPDADLAARAAAGDDDAFEALVVRFKDRLFQLAQRFFPAPEDAEDIAQEVFLKMHRSMATYRADAPFEHWLLRIATNTCRDRLRERRRRPAVALAELTGAPTDWLDRALGGAALTSSQADEARRVASALLDTLPAKDRIVLVLMDLEGMSAKETAAAIGSTRAAVKVRALRARRALRRLSGRIAGRR